MFWRVSLFHLNSDQFSSEQQTLITWVARLVPPSYLKEILGLCAVRSVGKYDNAHS